MKTYKNFKIFFLVASIAGVLFSGYMSGVKFFSSVCAFNETCPLFWGMPACYFGFALFFLLLILSALLYFGLWNIEILSKMLFAVSLAGVIFAGYFSIGEIPLLWRNGLGAYFLGLPTCVMGCVFFVAILIASIIFKKRIKADRS